MADHATRVPLKRTSSNSASLGDDSQSFKRLKMNIAADKEHMGKPSLTGTGTTREMTGHRSDLRSVSPFPADGRSVQLHNDQELLDPDQYDIAIVKSFAENVTHMQDFHDITTLRKIK